MRIQSAKAKSSNRRGIILMVVLALLTLFAIVGITFVLYADSEATAARLAREVETQQRADMDPEEALAFILGQLIYDVNDDATGVQSGLRGHSFGRNMYGYLYGTVGVPGTNVVPFNGVGRLHTNGTNWPQMNPYKVDDYLMPNYTWFVSDGFLRDPERYAPLANLRTSPAAAQTNPFVGGNAPYTYPDLNSFFLAAVRSDGTVLTPSFHRPWLFNPGKAFNDMSNPNWTNPQGKYLILRPRPIDHPGFPAPDDPNGDVKNLVGAPGGNDSIWIDPGGPVLTAPDGTRFKMLVAPLIMDLDNRINVAAAGNVAGGGTASRSNQGWFPSEVNLSLLWSNGSRPAIKAEWLPLFLGNGSSYYGKYGPDKVPSGVLFASGSPAHVYGQADPDGRNELANGAPPTGPIQLPAVGSKTAPPTSCFPYFPPGYGSGSVAERITVSGGTITYRHPAAYPAYKPPLYTTTTLNSLTPPKTIPNDDLVFRPSDMEALLRPNSLGQRPVDTGSPALISTLLRLCPQSLGGTGTNVPQRRNWITTASSDLARPGLSPWILNPAKPSPYAVAVGSPSLPPTGNPIPFPTYQQRTQGLPAGTDFTGNWRALDATQVLGSWLGRIDLNRPLPPFPHMSSGATAAIVAPNARYDNAAGSGMPGPVQAQFQLAMQARQTFANDIYRRLLAITGVALPATPAAPTVVELAPRRWLAQLAANIVDYIDADEISTPFNFYTTADGLPAANIYQVTPTASTIPPYPGPAPGGNPDVPSYWVFGTELPRVLINEVLGEYSLPTNNAAPPLAMSNSTTNPFFNVQLWVELFNPMPAAATVAASAKANGSTLQPQDSLPVPLYMPPAGAGTTQYNPYQLLIVNNNQAVNSHGLWYNVAALNSNVLGTPQHERWANPTAKTPVLAGSNFSTGAGTVGTVAAPAKPTYSIGGPAGGLTGQTFMLVGPSASDTNNDITVAAGVPGATPFLVSPNMQYQVVFTAATATTPAQWSIVVPGQVKPVPISDNVNGVSVLLRRLANPHLPPNPFTAAGVLTYPTLPPNPYVTVDFVHGVPLNGYGLSAGKPVPISTFAKPIPPNNSPVPPASYGKLQPYAANFTQYAPQTTPRVGTVNAKVITNHHTLGFQDVPLANPFTWLVHLDRKLVSPMELLHVSGYPPFELTQRFIMVPNASNPTIPQPYSYTTATNVPKGSLYFQHYVPWFDQTRRLYRLFEMVETHDGASGISPVNGRVPGKININTLWDLPTTTPQIYQAIADPPLPANADNPSFITANVTAAFQNLLTLRTPGLATPALSANDRPFLGMGAGVATGDPQYPTNNGINHTLLTGGAGAAPTAQRLLQLPNATPGNPQIAHPYLQNELLTKIYSRLTTRSNVFAIFLTVGFFQVTNPNTSPPTLGPEIGRSEGRQVRHRMFAIVDRTNLAVFSTTTTVSKTSPAVPAPTPGSTTTATITLNNSSTYPTNQYTGASPALTAGAQLVIEPGTANEETVTITAVKGNQITANFLLAHPNPAVTGNTTGTYAISQRGNPGPWKRYDPRQDPAVVLYYSIID